MLKTLLKVVGAPVYVPMKVVETVAFKATDAVLTQIEKNQMTEITRKTVKKESAVVETKQEIKEEEITNITRKTAKTAETKEETIGETVVDIIATPISNKILEDAYKKPEKAKVEMEARETQIRAVESINVQKMTAEILEKVQEEFENMKNRSANIIIAGKTGAGKSTLINAVFGEKLAATGSGAPVTQNMKLLSKQGIPIKIYDTKGLELEQSVQDSIKREINDVIHQKLIAGNENEYIHMIWYCVNCAGSRIEKSELEWINTLLDKNNSHNVSIILVLTQSFSSKKSQELLHYIKNQHLNVIDIIPVLAEDYEIDEDYIKKAYGLDTLAEVTANALPEAQKASFANAQKVNLEVKVDRAKKTVKHFVAIAFGIGTSPIPFSDMPILIGTQVSMITSITYIFGLPIDKSIITAAISSIVGTGAASITGKAIVTNLLKLLPGVGQVVGGAISGATAGALTKTIGIAYIAILEELFKSGQTEALNNETKMTELLQQAIREQGKKI